MTFVSALDFRSASFQEYAADCILSSQDVEDDDLITAAISRLTKRFEDWTDDLYTSVPLTLDLDSDGGHLLMLPYRTTAVSSVTFRISDGTYTAAQTATAYRLSSSLNAAGDTAVTEQDYLQVVPGSGGLSWADAWRYLDPYRWPIGPRIVRVVGTFGWITPPADAKRAVAMLVYDHFKPIRADLGRASAYSTPDVSVNVSPTDDLHPSGIPRVDEIVARLKRNTTVAVG